MIFCRQTRLLGFLLLAVSLSSAHRFAGQPTVRTQLGRIAGRRLEKVDEYIGIRYADTPIRWAPARDPKPWGVAAAGRADGADGATDGSMDGSTADGADSRIFNATAFGPICVQPDVWWLDKGGAKMGEDCLWMNIWTPRRRHHHHHHHEGDEDDQDGQGDGRSGSRQKKKLPVMVWIHGGGNMYGAGSLPKYNGSTLAGEAEAGAEGHLPTLNWNTLVFSMVLVLLMTVYSSLLF
jgi:hypothetical protein